MFHLPRDTVPAGAWLPSAAMHHPIESFRIFSKALSGFASLVHHTI